MNNVAVARMFLVLIAVAIAAVNFGFMTARNTPAFDCPCKALGDSCQCGPECRSSGNRREVGCSKCLLRTDIRPSDIDRSLFTSPEVRACLSEGRDRCVFVSIDKRTGEPAFMPYVAD